MKFAFLLMSSFAATVVFADQSKPKTPCEAAIVALREAAQNEGKAMARFDDSKDPKKKEELKKVAVDATMQTIIRQEDARKVCH